MNALIKRKIVYTLISFSLAIYLLTFSITSYANPLSLPTISADAAILIDAKTGEVLFEKNSSTQLYPASITKLMTALLVIENLKPTDVITFSEEAIHSIEVGSSSIGMRVGEQITVDQALRGLLLMSANEIASALAEKVSGSINSFSSLMTRRAHELGALNTNFTNPHGLHSNSHYTTAYDMALITQELLKHDYFLEIMDMPITEIPPTNKSTTSRPLSQQHLLMNEIKDSRYYRSDVTGGKTGFTNEAQHTLVTTASRNGIDLIVVILKSVAGTYYHDTISLLDYGFDSYHAVDLHSPSDVVETLSLYAIQTGELFETAVCTISVPEQQSILVPTDIKFRELTTEIELPDYLQLGVEHGHVVGEINYISNNQVIARNDLIVSEIDFTPSPFSASLPKTTTLIFPTSFFVILAISILILLAILLILRNNYNRRRLRYRKLKFNGKVK